MGCCESNDPNNVRQDDEGGGEMKGSRSGLRKWRRHSTSNQHDVYFRNRENKSSPTNLKEILLDWYVEGVFFLEGGGGFPYLLRCPIMSPVNQFVQGEGEGGGTGTAVRAKLTAAIPFLHHLRFHGDQSVSASKSLFLVHV